MGSLVSEAQAVSASAPIASEDATRMMGRGVGIPGFSLCGEARGHAVAVSQNPTRECNGVDASGGALFMKRAATAEARFGAFVSTSDTVRACFFADHHGACGGVMNHYATAAGRFFAAITARQGAMNSDLSSPAMPSPPRRRRCSTASMHPAARPVSQPTVRLVRAIDPRTSHARSA